MNKYTKKKKKRKRAAKRRALLCSQKEFKNLRKTVKALINSNKRFHWIDYDSPFCGMTEQRIDQYIGQSARNEQKLMELQTWIIKQI